MENVGRFVDKIRRGGVCLGTGITFTDPTSTEALCDLFDFLWIDMKAPAGERSTATDAAALCAK